VDYEDPLQIRQAKLIAADNAQEAFIETLLPAELQTGTSVAVIGAGPSGIAAAVFLRRNGVPVTVYEKRDRPFGIVQHIIPAFRISDKAINRDFRIAQRLGVEFIFNAPEEYSLAELRKTHGFVVIATGAWKEGETVVKQGQEKVIDALRFLEDSKKSGCNLELGKRIAVIGGGNVAMDCARAAKRNKGVEEVAVVYRRTREFMPSQYEEQEFALADGVAFMELLAPESFDGAVLCCEVMRLGEFDGSGRRGIEGTGEKRELRFDTVIGAVGARVDTGHFTRSNITLNNKGLPQVNAAGESSVPGVYIAGDCISGAATVVKAIAGGKSAAADILLKLGLEPDFSIPDSSIAAHHPPLSDLYLKKGIIAEAQPDSADACRCLSCDTLCEICADVCPNRANVMVKTAETSGVFRQPHQIVHVDRSCNECGNCAVFCPHVGKPYKEKFTVFSCEEDFTDSENPGFLKTGAAGYKLRLEDKSIVDYHRGDSTIPNAWAAMIETIESRYGYLLMGS
jgi:putative selenate reductase